MDAACCEREAHKPRKELHCQVVRPCLMLQPMHAAAALCAGQRLEQQGLIRADSWLGSGKPDGMKCRDSQLNRWEACSCPSTACARQAGMAVHVVSTIATALLKSSTL